MISKYILYILHFILLVITMTERVTGFKGVFVSYGNIFGTGVLYYFNDKSCCNAINEYSILV